MKTVRMLFLALLVLCLVLAFAACEIGSKEKDTADGSGSAATGENDNVKFHVDFVVDGWVIHTVRTAGNESVSLPQDPVVYGKSFDGWYWDENEWKRPFTADSLLDQPLTSDLTVYAKLSPEILQFTGLTLDDAEFIYDGMPQSIEVIGVPFGATVTYTGNEQTEEGTYTVTATVSKDGYETVTLTATLTIAPDLSASEICSFEDFTFEDGAYRLTLPNSTETYSFSNKITVSDHATWQLCADELGQNVISSMTVSLSPGDNTFYVLVFSGNQACVSQYSVTIYRRPTYTVTFETNGGTPVDEQVVDEDGFATPPTTTRDGYTFVEWDYDFSEPVRYDTTVSASWTPDTDTAYTVRYYLQNAEGTGYDLAEEETEYLTGTTDTFVSAEPKTFPHFIHVFDAGVPGGNLEGDGSLVLEFYYTRELYTVIFYGNGGTLTEGKTTQTVRYGNPAIIPTFSRDGYTLGWDDVSGCAAVVADLRITAQWTPVRYLISYDLNGGTLVGSNPSTYTVEDDFTLFSPTQEYYRFLGWYDADGTQITSLTGQSGDLALTARWECNFTFNGSGAVTGVSDYCKQNVSELEIPASWDGAPITSIAANAFANYKKLTSIVIPDGITSIGDSAFSGCTGLASVAIPGGVSSIADSTFSGCAGLHSVTIPDGVATVGENAFYGCSMLTSVEIGSGVVSIGENAFFGCVRLIEVRDRSALGITVGSSENGCVGYYADHVYADGESNLFVTDGGYVFYDDGINVLLVAYYGSDTALTFPADYKGREYAVYRYAFYECFKMVSVEIGSGVTGIGDSAFSGCRGLFSITIPAGIVSIGKSAFSGCYQIASVTWNAVNCASTGTRNNPIFSGCSSMTDLTIGDGVTSIPEYAFMDCTRLISVTIPENITSIGTDAFRNCIRLESVVWNATDCTYAGDFGNSAFNFCYGIMTVTFGDNVRSIPDYAFNGCDGITSVTIGNGVISIGNSAFNACSGLVSLTIGNSVESIGRCAFQSCYGLTSVTIPESVTSIDHNAFNGCLKLVEVINHSALSITVGSFENGAAGYYARRVYSDGESWLHLTDDGYLFYDDGINVFLVAYYGPDTELTLPTDYNGRNYAINTGTFCYSGLKSIVIPDAVTSIGAKAFLYCSDMLSVEIGSGVTSIGDAAFYVCSKLSSVTLPAGVKTIGDEAFWGCHKLISIIIPDNVKSIGDSAFETCINLTSITLPVGIKSIGNDAFVSCPKLTAVYYSGTLTEWCWIEFGSSHSNPVASAHNLYLNGEPLPSDLVIPNVLTTLKSYTFSGCTGLVSVTVPDSVTSVGEGAFYGCSSLERITIPFVGSERDKTASDLQQYPFSYIFGRNPYDGGTHVVQDFYSLSLESYASYNGYVPSSLRSVTVTGGNVILFGAFSDCSMLTSIILPDSVTSIEGSAFNGCSGLTSIVIPNYVESIGENAFMGCTVLTSVTFQNTSGWYVTPTIELCRSG